MSEQMQTSQPETPKKSNNSGLIIAIIVVVGMGIYFVSTKKQLSENSIPNDPVTGLEQSTSSTPSATTMPVIGSENVKDIEAVKIFEITSKNFAFSLNELKVKKGDKVKIVLKNAEGVHDFRVDEFNVKTEIISGLGTDEVEFTVDKTGTFEYYCSVGKHREMGMKGILIVE